MSIITSIISAKLTTTALSATYIMALKDVTQTLCVESNYQVLTDFVNRDPGKPVSIVNFDVNTCMQMLVAGEVQAVITDRTVLTWYTNYYQVANAFVGPMLHSNPFAWVAGPKPNGLLGYVNPSIIAATQTDANWIPLYSALLVRYFGVDSSGAIPVMVTKVERKTLIVALTMVGFAFFWAALNGDWGPGISRPEWLRKAIQQPKPNADMTSEQAALQGDDIAFVRYMIEETKLIKQALGLEEPPVGGVKVRISEFADPASNPKPVPPAHDLSGIQRGMVHGDAGAAAAMAALVHELREIRSEMADMRAQMLSQESVKTQVRDLKAQLRSQEVLKAQMSELQRAVSAQGGPLSALSAGRPASQQLPAWGLDRRL